MTTATEFFSAEVQSLKAKSGSRQTSALHSKAARSSFQIKLNARFASQVAKTTTQTGIVTLETKAEKALKKGEIESVANIMSDTVQKLSAWLQTKVKSAQLSVDDQTFLSSLSASPHEIKPVELKRLATLIKKTEQTDPDMAALLQMMVTKLELSQVQSEEKQQLQLEAMIQSIATSPDDPKQSVVAVNDQENREVAGKDKLLTLLHPLETSSATTIDLANATAKLSSFSGESSDELSVNALEQAVQTLNEAVTQLQAHKSMDKVAATKLEDILATFNAKLEALTTKDNREQLAGDIAPKVASILNNPLDVLRTRLINESTEQKSVIQETIDGEVKPLRDLKDMKSVKVSAAELAASLDKGSQNSFEKFLEKVEIGSLSGKQENAQTQTLAKLELASTSAADRTQALQQQENIFNQIVSNAKLRTIEKGTEISIKLFPENLGEVKIKVTQITQPIEAEHAVMTAKLEVSNSAVKEILETNLNAFRQSLEQNQGIVLSDISITVRSDSQAQMAFEQNMAGQNHNNAFHQSSPQNSQSMKAITEANSLEQGVFFA